MLPQALKSCPKCNKSPNLVTLTEANFVPCEWRLNNVPIVLQVAAVLRQMVEFKLLCKRRSSEHKCAVRWSWKREGILTILLQQQIMASITELIDP